MHYSFLLCSSVLVCVFAGCKPYPCDRTLNFKTSNFKPPAAYVTIHRVQFQQQQTTRTGSIFCKPGKDEEEEEYKPPRVWTFDQQGGAMGKINKPTSGSQFERELPKGEHPLQLYSLGTPNGIKVTCLLEALNMHYGLEYDAWFINILDGDQFGSGFVNANPNSKIPAMLHYEQGDAAAPTRVFESAAIMMYLCEKFDGENKFLPAEGDPLRSECLSWLFWVQGSAPFLGGGFGHFYKYAPNKIKYPIDRYAMEAKRLFDVLDKHLATNKFLCGDRVTIADICCWPWFGVFIYGEDAKEFLQYDTYENLKAWSKRMQEFEAIKRGIRVNACLDEYGVPKDKWLKERHSADDLN